VIAPPRKAVNALQQGFTLVELVMVIVILGIIGAMVSVFMKSPIDAYVASARRAALTDVADTTVRRMARDIHKALPNSIRLTGDQCVEFIPTRTGGRYRADLDAAGLGDPLDFIATAPADGSFDMLGANSTLDDQAIKASDLIAVYNLGIAGADAYNADNTSVVSSVAAVSLANETKINISPKQFPFASPTNRFHVIPGDEKVVAYSCYSDGSQTNLYRIANYAFSSSSTCPASGGNLLAKNVTCSFVYNASNQRNALLQLTVKFTDSSGEAVNLYHEIHLDNTP
jgi:MSHA biogenesis protein MshO